MNNLHVEDIELQEFILSEADTAIPLEIFRPEGSTDAEVLVYPCCLPALASRLKRESDLFLKENITDIQHVLTPLMEENGFVASPDGVPCICEYRLDSGAAINRSLILPETVMEYDDCPEEEAKVSAFHIAEGRKAAAAALNDLCEDDSVEIHVECQPAYRKRGYASSCVAKLTEYYTGKGHSVRYLCRIQNKASMRIAEKVGFRLEGRRLSFVYYRRGSL